MRISDWSSDVCSSDLGTDDYHGGRLIRSDANLHPALFHQGLLDRAIQAGVTVVGRARVTAVEREGKGFIVTAGGNKVAAREVVIASNGYTGAESPDRKSTRLNSSH